MGGGAGTTINGSSPVVRALPPSHNPPIIKQPPKQTPRPPGYNSSRLYKTFRGTDFKKNTLVTAFLFPGVIFTIFMILNFAVAAQVGIICIICVYIFVLWAGSWYG